MKNISILLPWDGFFLVELGTATVATRKGQNYVIGLRKNNCEPTLQDLAIRHSNFFTLPNPQTRNKITSRTRFQNDTSSSNFTQLQFLQYPNFICVTHQNPNQRKKRNPRERHHVPSHPNIKTKQKKCKHLNLREFQRSGRANLSMSKRNKNYIKSNIHPHAYIITCKLQQIATDRIRITV